MHSPDTSGGWVDTVVSRLLEAQLSLPLLMMLLLVVALFGPSIPVITFVIAIAQWPEIARLTRSLVLVEREKPYIAAARVLGLGKFAILVRHVCRTSSSRRRWWSCCCSPRPSCSRAR